MISGEKKERRLDPTKMDPLPPYLEELEEPYKDRFMALSKANRAKLDLLLTWYDKDLGAATEPAKKPILLRVAVGTLRVAEEVALKVIEEEMGKAPNTFVKRVGIRLLEEAAR